MTVTLYNGDCLDVMATLEAGSVDAVITDPPYGCNKAEWDNEFPTAWYDACKRLSVMIAIITGSVGLRDTIPLVGDDFIDVIAAWNMNGMTRSNIGFGNWLAVVIACSKPRQGQNVLKFTTSDKVTGHPTIKQVEFMVDLVERLSSEEDTILDPFMGSGTTGVACVETGRNFIGIEIDADYFAIAQRRIADAQARMNGTARKVDGSTVEALPMFKGDT